MKDRYFFPAVFEYESENSIGIFFPDLPGCYSAAENEEEALEMAREVLSLHIYGMEEDHDMIPEPSKVQTIKRDNDNQVCVLVDVYMVPIRDKMHNKKIKKTLTIKKWIDDLGMKNKINFSEVLENAIIQKFNLKV